MWDVDDFISVSQTGLRELCCSGGSYLLQCGQTDGAQCGEVKFHLSVGIMQMFLSPIKYWHLETSSESSGLILIICGMIWPQKPAIDLSEFLLSEGKIIDLLSLCLCVCRTGRKLSAVRSFSLIWWLKNTSRPWSTQSPAVTCAAVPLQAVKRYITHNAPVSCIQS